MIDREARNMDVQREMLKGFEINTDMALVNPDWEQFEGTHDRHYGLAISHIKSLVKGRAYDNSVMRVRVGKTGFYVQSRQFPAAFFGDTTVARVRFVSQEEAEAVTWECIANYRSGEAESLTSVYSGGERPEFFFGYRLGSERRYEYGSLKTGLALHLRVMLNQEEPSGLLGQERRGVVVYQQLRDGRHVVITAPGRRQPYPALSYSVE